MLLGSCSLYSFPGHLPSIQSREAANGVLILRSVDLLISNGQDDFKMYGMSLVRIYATMGTVRATAGFLDRIEAYM